ncbi:MAG: hypothetical protein ABIG95_03675 [Candidatus Woesearchaeota archaeon]
MGAEISEVVLPENDKAVMEKVMDDLKAVNRVKQVSFGKEFRVKI